ncbi:hypothetical protein ACQP1O_10280 [Nocardia sp. CA-151230]|uniref:hypothetical protein n=1 Tax=Nocardia sp. CA-151230 TaxID=3239982 RepID=UPI003D8FCD4E
MRIRGGRDVIDAGTAFLAALIAGLSLMVPIDFAWTSRSSALHLELLVFSMPQAIAAGALVAIVIAVMSTALGGQSLRWGVALGGAALLFVDHLLGRHAVLGTSLATLNFLDSIAGGLILGGSGAGVLSRSRVESRYTWATSAWLLGAIGGVVAHEFIPEAQAKLADPHFPQNWPAIDAPPLWLIALALLVIGLRFLREPGGHPVETPTTQLPIVPIIAGAFMIGVSLVGCGVLARHGDSPLAIAVTAAATAAGALLTAFMLPRRDGVQVLLAVALVGAGSAVLVASLRGWSIPGLVVLVAGGLVAGIRWPGARVAAVGIIGLSGYAVLTVAVGHPVALTVLGHALLALLTGYCFGAVTPRYASTRVLGIALIYVPSPVLALRDYTRRGHCLLIDPGKPCTIADFTSFAPGWAALALAVGCALGLWALLRRRPEQARAAAPAS